MATVSASDDVNIDNNAVNAVDNKMVHTYENNLKSSDVSSNASDELDSNIVDNNNLKSSDVNVNNKMGNSGSSNVLSVSETVGTFKELHHLIRGSGDILVLNKNYTYSSTDTDYLKGITITQPIIIDGNGFTLDAKGHQLFNIVTDNVTLRNLNLINICNSSNMTGVNYLSGGIYARANNIEFYNINVTYAKFAFVFNICSNVSISKVNFNHCNESAIYAYICDDFTVTDSSFNDFLLNQIKQGASETRHGTVSSYYSKMNVGYCNFTNSKCNNAFMCFHGVFVECGEASVDHCRFINLTGTSYTKYALFQCIYSNGYNLTNCLFANNSYANRLLDIVDVPVYIANCTFVDNYNYLRSIMHISSPKFCLIDGCVFENNRGAIEVDTPGLSILNTLFNKNKRYSASVQTYLIYGKGDFITVDKCNFTSNEYEYLFFDTKGQKNTFSNSIVKNNIIDNAALCFTNNTYFNEFSNVFENCSKYPSSLVPVSFTVQDIVYASPDNLTSAINSVAYGGKIYLEEGIYNPIKIDGGCYLVGLNRNGVIISNSNLYHIMGIENLTLNATLFHISLGGQIKDCNIVNSSKVTENFVGTSVSNTLYENVINPIKFKTYQNLIYYNNITIVNCSGNLASGSDNLMYGAYYFNNFLVKNSNFTYVIFLNGQLHIDNFTLTDSNISSFIPYYNNRFLGSLDFNELNLINLNISGDAFFMIGDSVISNVYGENISFNKKSIFVSDGEDTLQKITLRYIHDVDDVVYQYDTNMIIEGFNISDSYDINNGFIMSAYSNLNAVNVYNVTFKNNLANLTTQNYLSNSLFDDFTGNIYINGDNIELMGDKFSNAKNSLINGGVIYIIGGHDIFIENCTFINNTGNIGGAVYINNSTNSTYMIKSNFINNTAEIRGGAVFVGPYIYYYIDNVTRDTFNTEMCFNDLYDNGAYVYIDDVWVAVNGSTDSNGTYDNPLTLSHALDKVSPFGTIHFRYENEVFKNIENLTLAKFYVTIIGNGTTLTESSLNILRYAQGFIIRDITFCNFTTNSSITNYAPNGLILNCTFKNNGGDYMNNGSAIYNGGENLTIIYCTFENNFAGADYAVGGAIYSNASGLSLQSSNFTNNSAYYAGGHIYTTESAEYLTVNNCIFSSGSVFNVRGEGSGIYAGSSYVKITDSTFSNNIGDNGGAIKFTYILCDLVITNNTFQNNSAVYNGGAVVFISSVIKNQNISNNSFINNSAECGGAIYSNLNLNISSSSFIQNNATYGGALYLNGLDNALSNIVFAENKGLNGSALYLAENNGLIMNNILVENNTGTVSDYFGDIYLADGVTFSVEDDSLILGVNPAQTIYNNTGWYSLILYISPDGSGPGFTTDLSTNLVSALNHILPGGILVFNGQEFEFEDIVLIENKNIILVGNGSTLKRKNQGNGYLFILENSTVGIENLTLNGGIDVSKASNLDLNNITFTANGGEGINYNESSTGSVVNSKFIGSGNLNHVIAVNGNVTIYNSSFADNNLLGSAVYYGSTGSGNITNSTFQNNLASTDVRNINITNIDDVSLQCNSYDAYLSYAITNGTYGASSNIRGIFDAGVNFAVGELILTINATPILENIVYVDANGNYSFDVSGKLGAGVYNLTASVDGVDSYIITYLNNSFTVLKANVEVTPSFGNVSVVYGYNDTLTINGTLTTFEYGSNYTGPMTVSIGSVNVPCDVMDGRFNATLTGLGILDVAEYELLIHGDDIDNFDFIDYIGLYNVTKATIVVTQCDNISVVYGKNDTVVVTGSFTTVEFGSNFTGPVHVKIGNNVEGDATVSDGRFNITLSGLAEYNFGEYIINITGAESTNFIFTEYNGLFNVTKATIRVTSCENITVSYGKNNTINITGSLNTDEYIVGYDGTVTISIGGISVDATVDGTSFNATLTGLGSLESKEYLINIRGIDTVNFIFIEYNGLYNVTPAVVTVTSLDNITVSYGGNDTVNIMGEISTVEYGSNYTGKITVSIGSVEAVADVGDGKFNATLTGLGKVNVGENDILIHGENTINFTFADYIGLYNVTPASVEITNIDNITVVYGANNTVNVTGTISSTAFGDDYDGIITVKIYEFIGTGQSSGGKFNIQLIGLGSLPVNEYPIRISGTKTGNYNAISEVDTGVYNVTRALADIDDIRPQIIRYGDDSVNITGFIISHVTYGNNYTGNITVSIKDHGANVTLKVNSDGSFVATINSLPKLDVGSYTVVVSLMGGDANYNLTSREFAHNLTVIKADPVISIANVTVIYGKKGSIVIRTNANGTYNVTVNNVSTVWEVNTSSFTVPVGILTVGSYDVTVNFTETDNFNAFNKVFKGIYNVVPKSITITLIGTTVKYGSVAFVKNNAPEDVTGTVTYTITGPNSFKKVIEQGAQEDLILSKLAVGTYTVNASCNDPLYIISFKSARVIVKGVDSIKASNMKRAYNSGMDYTARLFNSNKKPLAYAKVPVKVNTKKYIVRTDKNGVFILNKKLKVGNYKVIITNPKTGDSVTRKLQIVKRLVSNKDLTSDFDREVVFKVRAVGDNGDFVKAGKTVVIKVHGVTYKCKTNAKGYAFKKLNLEPGVYKIVSSYNGYSVVNSYTVRHVLRAITKNVTVSKRDNFFRVYVQLKSSDGSALVYKRVKFAIFNKVYVAKTDSKGIASFTVGKDIINKMQKSKTYNGRFSYIVVRYKSRFGKFAGDSVKIKVEVV